MEKNLNDAQMQAVLHKEGTMLVLAGPGSGKTLVITKRIENLIKTGVDPSRILVITFTKAAAKEMKERFLAMGTPGGNRVTFGTFHAVFFKMLKHAYHFQAESIIREEEKNAVLRGLMRSLQVSCDDEAEFIKNFFAEAGLLKNSRIDAAHYYPMSCGKDTFLQLLDGYQKYLRRHRKLDFDDILVETYRLLSEREDLLLAWREQYRYLLIDEFQDVNRIQYDIVRMLAEPANNLFIVGDDDQSIYRFRGAKPEIMLHMPEDYGDAKIVRLSYNYRCPKSVVEMADRVISHNKERFPKELTAVKKEKGLVTAEIFDTKREENLKVIERIRTGKIPPSQTAVLFRTNTQARLLMEQLMEYNIPFKARDLVPNLYEHWIAKDLYAYIRLASGSAKRKDVLMVMNRPKRYLSREGLYEDPVDFTAWKAFYKEQPWIKQRMEAFLDQLERLRKMRPFAAVNYIRKGIGYDAFLQEYEKSRGLEDGSLVEIVDTLQECSRPYASMLEWKEHIKAYTKELKESFGQENGKKDAVTLATFHSAKGLEFDAVHMIDVNEGVTPYKKAVLPTDLEEERRMFYVGMTRAKEELHLYAVKKLYNKTAEKSRFWEEAVISQTSPRP